MTEREALINAVVTSPADDLPRLVFADWLDENGDGVDRAWANYIREGVSGAWEGPMNVVDEHEILLRLWPCKLMPSEMRADMNWKRGFPDRLNITQSAFKPHAKHIIRRCPLSEVNLHGRQPRCLGPQTWLWWVRRDNGMPAERAEPSAWLFNELRHWLRGNRNPKESRSTRGGAHAFTYRTRDAAATQLSAACIRYGRWLAGLPQLDEVSAEAKVSAAPTTAAPDLFTGCE